MTTETLPAAEPPAPLSTWVTLTAEGEPGAGKSLLIQGVLVPIFEALAAAGIADVRGFEDGEHALHVELQPGAEAKLKTAGMEAIVNELERELVASRPPADEMPIGVGDTVALKSEPDVHMSVKSLGEQVVCQWFNDSGEIASASFAPAQLRRVS